MTKKEQYKTLYTKVRRAINMQLAYSFRIDCKTCSFAEDDIYIIVGRSAGTKRAIKQIVEEYKRSGYWSFIEKDGIYYFTKI